MRQVEQLQAEIEALSQEEYVRLRRWFAARDWELWDRELEADAAAGRLDELWEEAMAAKRQGTLQDL